MANVTLTLSDSVSDEGDDIININWTNDDPPETLEEATIAHKLADYLNFQIRVYFGEVDQVDPHPKKKQAQLKKPSLILP